MPVEHQATCALPAWFGCMKVVDLASASPKICSYLRIEFHINFSSRRVRRLRGQCMQVVGLWAEKWPDHVSDDAVACLAVTYCSLAVEHLRLGVMSISEELTVVRGGNSHKYQVFPHPVSFLTTLIFILSIASNTSLSIVSQLPALLSLLPTNQHFQQRPP
jgi:hypothetical protein